jgi:hypothetical protein
VGDEEEVLCIGYPAGLHRIEVHDLLSEVDYRLVQGGEVILTLDQVMFLGVLNQEEAIGALEKVQGEHGMRLPLG